MLRMVAKVTDIFDFQSYSCTAGQQICAPTMLINRNKVANISQHKSRAANTVLLTCRFEALNFPCLRILHVAMWLNVSRYALITNASQFAAKRWLSIPFRCEFAIRDIWCSHLRLLALTWFFDSVDRSKERPGNAFGCTQTDKQTDRQTDRQTGQQTNRPS